MYDISGKLRLDLRYEGSAPTIAQAKQEEVILLFFLVAIGSIDQLPNPQ